MNDSGRRIILIIISVFVSLVLAEAALRLTGWGAVTPELSFGVNTRSALEKGAFEPDADLFWKLPARPGPADAAIKAIHPDLPLPPRRAAKRILVLGDSCSRISLRGLPYSALLEQRLADDGYEVLNASVPGYTTHQGLVWLRGQLLDLEPDVVVIYFGWNDHWRATGMTDRQYAASRAASGLRLATLLKGRPDEAPVRVTTDEYRENLQAMVAACRERGSDVILVVAPHRITREAAARLVQTRYILPGENAAALHDRYVQVVRSMAADAGVSVLEASGLFAALPGDTPLLMRDGIHLTDPGHAVLAAALAVMITDGVGAGGTVPAELVAAGAAALTP